MRLAGRRADAEWVDHVVDVVGLGARVDHHPSELSGGQQQRVAVARALASRPEIVFADEPTGNLDSRTGAEILGFMRRAVREMGQTIVMVTHDPTAASYADRAVFLADGRIVDDVDAPTVDRGLRPHAHPGRKVMFCAHPQVRSGPRRSGSRLTSLAVVLGVAFMVGTMVLTQTIKASYDGIVDNVYASTDAVVRSDRTIQGENDATEVRATVGADVLARADPSGPRASPPRKVGPRAWPPSSAANGRLLDSSSNRPAPVALGWMETPALNPMEVVAGHPPRAPDEVVIDRTTQRRATSGRRHGAGRRPVRDPDVPARGRRHLRRHRRRRPGAGGGVHARDARQPSALRDGLGGPGRRHR